MSTTRERLIEAAFTLFDERGYAETTVDDVAELAGVGRTTFFRAFGSKEDVIFPDHDVVLGAVRDRLATATTATAPVAVPEAARLVLLHYLAEGRRSRIRYALTRSVPALRAREIASLQQYQQTFRSFLRQWMGDTPGSALRAELMANAVVTAHNHVLRTWLRSEVPDDRIEADFDRAMRLVLDLFHPTGSSAGRDGASLVVLHTTRDLDELLPALRELAGPGSTVLPD
jgi:AcrR family transcriptional regulator